MGQEMRSMTGEQPPERNTIAMAGRLLRILRGFNFFVDGGYSPEKGEVRGLLPVRSPVSP